MAVDYSIPTPSGSGGTGIKTGSTTTSGSTSSTSSAPSGAGMMAAAGFIQAYGASQAQQAAAINQQTGYMVAARDALVVSGIRADMSEQYAIIQAGRSLKKAESEAMNYQIVGNTLLKNMRSTNASIRARAAASGVALGGGSIEGVQRENVAATMRDVGVSDLNALTARVYGYEDAAALVQSTQYQNFLNDYTAKRQAGQYEMAASSSRQQGNLLSDATLAKGAYDYAKTRTP
jgi:hypothetical protein